MPSILVYTPESVGTTQIGGKTATLVKPKGKMHFDQFDLVIVLGDSSFLLSLNGEGLTSEAMKLQRAILTSAEKGSLVCLTLAFDFAFQGLLEILDMKFEIFDEPDVDLVIKRSEFKPFLQKFGGSNIEFSLSGRDDYDDIICETKNGDVAGFTIKIGKGSIVFLPRFTTKEELVDWTFLNEFLGFLLDALIAYQPRIQYKPPSWVNAYTFPKETPILTNLKDLQTKISDYEAVLKGYLKLKEVLWLRDDSLEGTVMNFFENMGIKTKKDEGFEEDFWILKDKVETVICEVKGLDKNLKRQHISQLDQHREARDKQEDFPALLVANTFNKANTLEQKDEDIPPNVIKKAIKTEVLLMRTLDLCNAYRLIEKEELSVSDFVKLLKEETGWLKVTESECSLRKE